MFARRTSWNLNSNRLSAALQQRRGAGRAILDLTISNPTECGFSYDSGAILAALSQTKVLHYQPEPFGLRCAREAVSDYYKEDRKSTRLNSSHPSTSYAVFCLKK